MISFWYRFDVILFCDSNYRYFRNMRGHYIHIFPGFSRCLSPFFNLLKFTILRPIRIHYLMGYGNIWENTRGLVIANRFLTGGKYHGSTTNHHTPKPITSSATNFTNSILPLSPFITKNKNLQKIHKIFLKNLQFYDKII